MSCQTATRDNFYRALYHDEIENVNYTHLCWDKAKSQMALTHSSKPSLSSVYTKYRIKNKVLCEPYP